MKFTGFSKIAVFLSASLLTTSIVAQPPGGGQNLADLSPREGTPGNLQNIEGQWVSIVNEDWLWRMRVPEKGDFTSIPYNARAREVGEAWDESMANSCLRYGAAGIMRQPMRIRTEWDSDSVLTLETDYGQQTRRFIFNEAPPANTARSLQGYSQASWEYDVAPIGNFGGFGVEGQNRDYGSLKVETSHLTAAWLRANGAPVSENATVTEYFTMFQDPTGIDWLVATVVVHDPTYLNQDFITSSHFRRENSPGGWDPRPCGM